MDFTVFVNIEQKLFIPCFISHLVIPPHHPARGSIPDHCPILLIYSQSPTLSASTAQFVLVACVSTLNNWLKGVTSIYIKHLFKKIAQDHTRSPNITQDHPGSSKSLMITQDHQRPPKTPKITQYHPRSSKITQDHLRAPKITKDHQRSPKITKDCPRSPKITQDQPRSTKIT